MARPNARSKSQGADCRKAAGIARRPAQADACSSPLSSILAGRRVDRVLGRRRSSARCRQSSPSLQVRAGDVAAAIGEARPHSTSRAVIGASAPVGRALARTRITIVAAALVGAASLGADRRHPSLCPRGTALLLQIWRSAGRLCRGRLYRILPAVRFLRSASSTPFSFARRRLVREPRQLHGRTRLDHRRRDGADHRPSSPCSGSLPEFADPVGFVAARPLRRAPRLRPLQQARRAALPRRCGLAAHRPSRRLDAAAAGRNRRAHGRDPAAALLPDGRHHHPAAPPRAPREGVGGASQPFLPAGHRQRLFGARRSAPMCSGSTLPSPASPL